MNTFVFDHLNNTTLLEYITFSWSTFCGYFLNSIFSINDEETSKITVIFEILSDLKAYFIIIIVNFLLIFIAWRIYNKRISDQFMKPGNFYLTSLKMFIHLINFTATIKAIEDLKASVSKLRLPKEHSPRI